ncbi:MAG TPA: fused MFS/spermidine synthase [Caulobacteraceae bacterium]
MSSDAAPGPRAMPATPMAFALAAFCGAALIFAVQPMVAKLVLPLLGGSPAVWNTSMAFFQAALLAGYGYAHLLQRLKRVRTQAWVHLGVLAVSALVLPLRISGLVGPPSSEAPALWLLAVLVLSIGAPFAALSATAPLVQAWHARVFRGERGEPYVLYAASNLGSLIALLVYPVVIEPLATLQAQRFGWSAAYVLFALVLVWLAVTALKRDQPPPATVEAPRERTSWRERLMWMALAAMPSSLMLGVTAYLTTDVASAPFLWVVPLALYLLTFIIAFQRRPAIAPGAALLAQAVMLPVCVYLLPIVQDVAYSLPVHLVGFFFSALVCHQALVARRPEPGRLTEFYLYLSLGGVIGGAFNAFAAPVIFDRIVEYPLMLVLVALARPWRKTAPSYWEISVFVTGVLAAIFAWVAIKHPPRDILTFSAYDTVRVALIVTVVCAFMLRDGTRSFVAMLAVLSIAADATGNRHEVVARDRSFFGVLTQTRTDIPELGGEVRLLFNGTTLHGAQARDPRYRCQPLTYYAAPTAMGQVFRLSEARKANLDIATVGLGTGTVAAFTRKGDRLTFFEIDPLVIRIATDPTAFSYTTECARGQVSYVVGDARLKLAGQPADSYDLLLVDAFSSDSIPAHLLTVEAVRMYFSRLRPDGVLMLHLSHRHLDLEPAALAAVKAAGGYSLIQHYETNVLAPRLSESPEHVLIASRDPKVLEAYLADSGWEIPPPSRGRPWTDDYMNLIGALIAGERQNWGLD